jgi:hypothetical protein
MSHPPLRRHPALEGRAVLLVDPTQPSRDVPAVSLDGYGTVSTSRTFLTQPAEGTRMDRVRFVNHKGKQILLVDMSDCGPEEVTKIAGEVQGVVARQSRQSVLSLADFRGTRFSRAAFTRIKEVAVFNRPFVKRSAFVGAESLPNAFYEGLKIFSRREFPRFKTREEAMDWLVQENTGKLRSEPSE